MWIASFFEVCIKEVSKKKNFNIYFGRIGKSEIVKEGFYTKSKLNNYLQTHAGKKNHIFYACNKRFSKKKILNNHFWTHTGEPLHVYEICNEWFLKRGNLSIHLQTHTCKMLHVSEVYNKGFSKKNIIISKHIQI